MKLLLTILRKTSLIVMLVLPVWLMAQPKINSPYSRYGFGEIADNNFTYSQMMGGLGASYVSPHTINIVNPASLSYLGMTAFDVGISAKLASFKDSNTETDGLWSGNLSYISLAFPLKNSLNDLLDRKVRDINFGMAITLKPYSEVGYNIESVTYDDEIGQVRRAYQGFGGSYDFTWSNAMQYKDFSVGVNLGYLFGKATRQRLIEFGDLANAENSLLENVSNYRGFVWRLGGLYTLKLNEAKIKDDSTLPLKRITFGVHGNSKSNFTTDNSTFQGVAREVALNSFQRDTFSFISEEGLAGKLPAELGLGMTYYSAEKLALGVNYTTTRWSGFNSSVVNEQLNNINNLSFGGFYRPNHKSINSYLSRVMYRFGVYYKEIPTVVVETEKIDDIGFTVGMSLPFFYQRKISHAHIGVALGIKGRETIIEERYLKMTFSFTFNDDEWFMKRKYN